MKQNFAQIDFQKYCELQKYLYTTRVSTPRGQIDEEIKSILYPYTALNPREDVAFFDGIKHADVLRVYAERLLSARDFTYCIVGDITEAEARQLTERYIASLPEGTIKEREGYRSLNFASDERLIKREFEADLEGDVGEVEIAYSLGHKLSEREELALPVLETLLQARLFEELREREQGVYSIGVQLQYEPEPQPEVRLNIHFNTERAKVDRMKQRTYELLDEVVRGEVSQLAFKQALVPHVMNREEVAQTPEDNPLIWLLYLNAYVETGKAPELNKAKTGVDPKVEELKLADLSTLIRKLITEGKQREIVVKSKENLGNYLH